MARIRSIKPEFWVDDQIVELDYPARLLFIGLWNFVDDEGYIEFKPKRIKMQIFPADDLDVSGGLRNLLEASRIEELDSDQGPLLKITNWERHQKVSHKTNTRFTGIRPPSSVRPPENSGTLMVRSALNGIEGNRREGNNVEAERPDAMLLCDLLADLIEQNGSRRPAVGKGWVDAARLLIDKDKRDPEKAANLIRWCQSSEFWRATILSMPKFREKYDQLRLQALREHEQSRPKVDPDAWMQR